MGQNGGMSGDYQPRENDHLVEPMIDAIREEGAAELGPEPLSRGVAWAPLLVPLGGIAIAILVWAGYRLFS
jgi:hypothetical protein